jgi:hypothetical protein
MRTITVGAKAQYVTIVSDEDYEYLAQFKWTFAVSHAKDRNNNVYVRRCIRRDGRKFDLFMHHVVLDRMGEARPEPDWTADHRNTDSLDNRRGNLRWASPALQAANRRAFRTDQVKRAIAAERRQAEEIPF